MKRSHKFSWIYLAPLLVATPVMAENQAICDDLRGQLANISETVSINHQLRKYSSAIVQQTFEIRKANNDLRDNECSSGSVTVVNGQDKEICAGIQESLQHMQDNLQALTERRDEIGLSTGRNGNSRGDLVTALHAHGCDMPDADNADTVITNRPDMEPFSELTPPVDASITPLDQSGGPTDMGSDPNLEPTPSYAYGESFGGSVRTVCVRTCDGGFFPMTAGAGPNDFQRDGETCAKMCPGVKTELFFHRWPNQETSTMVSASNGAPYSAMPYAFAFRKRPPNEKSSCTCNLPAYYEEMRRANALSQPDSPVGTPQGSIITIAPKAQPAPAQTAKTTPPPQPVPDRPYDPSANKVRQVGPQFLSTDQSNIDLKHPAAPGAQPEQ